MSIAFLERIIIERGIYTDQVKNNKYIKSITTQVGKFKEPTILRPERFVLAQNYIKQRFMIATL